MSDDATMQDQYSLSARGWQDIACAPQDGRPVWVYTAMHEGLGLPPFEGSYAWHADAGFCTDELRPVTHWHPERTKMLRDAERYRATREAIVARGLDFFEQAEGLSTEQFDALIDAKMARDPEAG